MRLGAKSLTPVIPAKAGIQSLRKMQEELEKTVGGLAERGYAPDLTAAINRNNAEKLFARFAA